MIDLAQPPMHVQPAWREWDELVAATPGAGFMQTAWWAEHRNALGTRNFGAILRSGGHVLGGAVVERRVLAGGTAFYHVSDGPVIPPDAPDAGDVWVAILAMIDERRRTEPVTVSHLRIQPGWSALPPFVHGFAAPSADDGLTEQHDGATVDLTGSDGEWFGRMDPCARAGVGGRGAEGVVLVEDPSQQGVSDFVSLLGPHGLDTWPGASSPDVLKHLVPSLRALGRGSLWFASQYGDRIAGALVVKFGKRTVAFHAGRVAPAQHADAGRMLHVALMREARAAGCTTYEIRPAVPASGAESLWPGFSAFRRSLSAATELRVPAVDLVYDRMAYMQHMSAAAGEFVVTGR